MTMTGSTREFRQSARAIGTPGPADRRRTARRWRVPTLAICVLLAGTQALAVTQPDGTVIPTQNDLQRLFTSRADPINALSDAAITPETFQPGCRLTFTLISRGGAGFQNAFGWYNVTGAAPASSDLHVLIPCGARPGFVAPLDLRSEPAYRGGAIGFFMRTPQAHGVVPADCTGGDCCATVSHPGYTYYSERTFNPDNTSANPYIHLLVYDSRAMASAFYFAWEDLFGGGDNEFTDFVALVGNIACTGAGASCDTGMQGACGVGSMQCRAGRLQCVVVTQPSPERCDGIDNDCNGMTDEGAGLCSVGSVCDRGVCVQSCVEGACFPGSTCSPAGLCVESTCVGVTCPSGQHCVGAHCVDPCNGVRCPGDQLCRVGRCLDGCTGVTCDAEEVCVAGACQARCPCHTCAAGQTCGSDGRCTDTACATVTCQPGLRCVGGLCVDACVSAICPVGQHCAAGACVDTPVTGGDGGGPATDAGRTDARALDGARDGGSNVNNSGGCACSTAGGRHSGSAGAWFAIALGIALRAASRRRLNRGRC